MKKYKGYLIDLDGTVYKGNERIEGASQFIETLSNKNIPYLFITNNSAMTQENIANKLNEMGIHSTPDQVFTSGLATAKFIKNKRADARCMVIGEEGLYKALDSESLIITESACDYVVIGLDRAITYDKFAKACQAIYDGAEFISTNNDIAIPTESGLIPGNGALTSVLTTSTGVQPTFIGKPEKTIVDEALAVLGTKKTETLIIGDNYHTDITAGFNSGIDTLMVFTGITPYEKYLEIEQVKKPTYHAKNLLEWIEHI